MKACTIVLLSMVLAPALAADAWAQSLADRARGSPRIIGGTDVLPGQGPWAASLRTPADAARKTWRHFCGGSFVFPRYDPLARAVVGWSSSSSQPDWVLTAAHCVTREGVKVEEADIRVLGGTLDLSKPESAEEQDVERIIVHPGFDHVTLQNDIALLNLRPAKKDIHPTLRTSIRLPDSADISWIVKPYLAVRAQGWGRTETGYLSSTLREVLLPLVDRQTCRNAFDPVGVSVPNGVICAGFVSGDFDSCQGDSGGPLVYRSQYSAPRPGFAAEPTLIGVVSWGIGCGTADLYGVYTSTMAYRFWADAAVAVHFASKK